METTKRYSIWRAFASGLITCSVVLTLPSCSEKDDWLADDVNFKSLTVDGIAYYGPETFTTTSKDPLIVTQTITNPDFKYLENFVIKIQNGPNKTKCKSIEVKIDGVVVVSSEDFKKNVNPVIKPLIGLTDHSLLEVQIVGSKAGCYIELLIECTLMEDVIADIDGNFYHTVEIGNQCWMAENLKTTHFNDGTGILLETDGNSWANLYYTNLPAYCWYNNDEATYKLDYGALYNKYAAESGNLCPTDWHVPSFEEWQELVNYVQSFNTFWTDEEMEAGGMLKEVGFTHWASPNTGATNETGFTALPGGVRFLWPDGTSFREIHLQANWWHSSPPIYGDGYYFYSWVVLKYHNPSVSIYGGAATEENKSESAGMSIRCLKDN